MGRSRSRSPRRKRSHSGDRDRERRRRERRSHSRSRSKDRRKEKRSEKRRSSWDRDERRERKDKERRRRGESSRERDRDRGGKSEKKEPILIDIGDDDLFEGKTDEEIAMMKLMGFTGFDSTKGKKVAKNDAGAVHHVVVRKYRQYMNRKGGFNRPLDFVN